MAIKGKSKRRGGKARITGAPRPVITERKPPFIARKGVRRGILVMLVVLALLGGLRVWQNLGRSNSLKKYDRALQRSQALLTTHLEPASLTNLGTNIQQFTEGKLDAKRFMDLASLWENDFKSARDTVAKLQPVEQLREAQTLILRGIDGYIGVARLYQLIGQQKQIGTDAQNVAKAAKDPAQKKTLEAQAKKQTDLVQAYLLNAGEWRDRADTIYKLGTDKVNALKIEWGIESTGTSEPGIVPQGYVPAASIRRAA